MTVRDLRRINEAPNQGTYLIYTRKKVLFGEYTSVYEAIGEADKDEILEVHLFDSASEYRAITSESRRRDEGVVEYIADFADERDSVYRENCMLESGGYITVLNHITYDKDNGMAVIDDYRLIGGKYE